MALKYNKYSINKEYLDVIKQLQNNDYLQKQADKNNRWLNKEKLIIQSRYALCS